MLACQTATSRKLRFLTNASIDSIAEPPAPSVRRNRPSNACNERGIIASANLGKTITHGFDFLLQKCKVQIIMIGAAKYTRQWSIRINCGIAQLNRFLRECSSILPAENTTLSKTIFPVSRQPQAMVETRSEAAEFPTLGASRRSSWSPVGRGIMVQPSVTSTQIELAGRVRDSPGRVLSGQWADKAQRLETAGPR